MRLSAEEQQAIREVVAEMDQRAEVFLFGSRARDEERGGDIDLLIMSGMIGPSERRRMKLRLMDRLGERKNEEEYDALEAFASRFARVSDWAANHDGASATGDQRIGAEGAQIILHSGHASVELLEDVAGGEILRHGRSLRHDGFLQER